MGSQLLNGAPTPQWGPNSSMGPNAPECVQDYSPFIDSENYLIFWVVGIIF
jgi:hypothetical protein